jgi:hypothetical protein
MVAIDAQPAPGIPKQSVFEGTKSVSLAGLLLIYLTAVVFGIICYLLIKRPILQILDVTPEVVLFIVGCFSAFLGVSLVRNAGLSTVAPKAVINPLEWQVISDEVKQGKEEAITQYIRLTSLTGLTGFLTKLGLQGLPLATIGMTIFFSILFLEDAAYLDLAKLTLGAFIGSFVQRQISGPSGGGTVQLPSGERIRVSPTPPTIA